MTIKNPLLHNVDLDFWTQLFSSGLNFQGSITGGNIYILGKIGSGKSTLMKNLNNVLNQKEEVNFSDIYPELKYQNPYLDAYYDHGGKKSVGTIIQVQFLLNRLLLYNEALQKLLKKEVSINIFDGSIQSDGVFCGHLLEAGLMDQQDYNLCLGLRTMMLNKFVPTPSMVIFLDVSTEKALERISLRDRPEETKDRPEETKDRAEEKKDTGISSEYLDGLGKHYEILLQEFQSNGVSVHRFNWDDDLPEGSIGPVESLIPEIIALKESKELVTTGS